MTACHTASQQYVIASHKTQGWASLIRHEFATLMQIGTAPLGTRLFSSLLRT
jgi:hypothetical protein